MCGSMQVDGTSFPFLLLLSNWTTPHSRLTFMIIVFIMALLNVLTVVQKIFVVLYDAKIKVSGRGLGMRL